MSIALPPELAPLLAECGGAFPEADEDRLHELAEGWRRTSRTLERLRQEGSETGRPVTATQQGATIDAFHGRWTEIDAHFALGAVAAEQAAAAVDAMALATVETKSAIISVLAAGHAQRQEMQSQAAVAFLGPLIRVLLQLLRSHIGPLLARLGQLIKSGLAALFRGIKRRSRRSSTSPSRSSKARAHPNRLRCHRPHRRFTDATNLCRTHGN